MTNPKREAREIDPEIWSLPALTLWQPYASLIAIGAKPYETRHWRPPSKFIGQRIAIHAALRRPTGVEIDELRDDCEDAFGFCHWHQRLPYGAVVCTAILTAVYSTEDVEPDPFGNYFPGRFAWKLNNVIQVPNIPAKGRQGWWRWIPPPGLIAQDQQAPKSREGRTADLFTSNA